MVVMAYHITRPSPTLSHPLHHSLTPLAHTARSRSLTARSLSLTARSLSLTAHSLTYSLTLSLTFGRVRRVCKGLFPHWFRQGPYQIGRDIHTAIVHAGEVDARHPRIVTTAKVEDRGNRVLTNHILQVVISVS